MVAAIGRRSLVGLASLIALVACDGRGPSGEDRTRAIRPDPRPATAKFVWESVLLSRVIDPDPVADRPELLRWKPIAGSDSQPEGDYIFLPRLPTTLRRPGVVDTREADALRLSLRGLGFPGFVRLSWTTADDPARERHALIHRTARRSTGDSLEIQFDLRSQPGWRGQAANIELLVGGTPAARTALTGATWISRTANPGALAKLAGQRLAVELAGEERPSDILPCGAARELALDAGGPWLLDFGIGLPPGRQPQGTLLVVGDRKEFGRIDFGGSAHEGWRDARFRIDFDRDGGRLRLVAECSDAREDSFLFLSEPLVGKATSKGPAPLVVLISIDTLRADRMSLYGYARPTTPRLAAWAERNAAVFRRAMAPAATTLSSHASLFTGLPVLIHGAYNSNPLPPGFITLAEALREGGYLTFAATGGAFVHPGYGFSQGFDRFRHWPRGERQPSEELPETLNAARAWLARYRDWPLFLFLHTYEVHGPFYPRPEHRPGTPAWTGAADTRIWPEGRLASRADRSPQPPGSDPFSLLRLRVPSMQTGPEVRALSASEFTAARDFYDGGIARADDLIGELLEFLEGSVKPDRPVIIVVTSDHGEALGEDGLWGHGFLHQSNLRVPLAIGAPEVSSPGDWIEPVVGLQDLFPTILELAGVSTPVSPDARSLVPLLKAGSQASARDEVRFSYAPETAQGLAVRDRRAMFILRDSAFAPTPLPSESYRLLSGEASPLPESAAEIQALRRLAVRELSRPDIRGLSLTVTNRTNKPAAGTLAGDGLRLDMVKWSRSPCAGCFTAISPGSVEVRLPPGQSASVRLVLPQDRLELSLREPEGPILETSLKVATVCARAREILGGRTLSVTARFHGTCLEASGDPAAADEDLRANLRALGYL